MATPRFIQIHFLTPFAGVLLNRDDAGLAKRMSFGGAVRTRVSSQSLKRHWRTADDNFALSEVGSPMSVRSRDLVDRLVAPRLAERLPSVAENIRKAACDALNRNLYGGKADDKSKRQALLLGSREVDYLTDILAEIIQEASDEKAAAAAVNDAFKEKEGKARLSFFKKTGGDITAGLEAALFGRMVTSDPAANTDAALHVAHAFTVNQQESETDYFTVVDDLADMDENADTGSAGIFDTEITSGLFYGYVVVDVPALVANTTGVGHEDWASKDTDRSVASRVVEHLVHLIATVSPGAKRGSTAPYSYASTMLIEAGDRQPRSLAGAFEVPVKATRDSSVSDTAGKRMLSHLSALDRAYGSDEARRLLTIHEYDGTEIPQLALGELAKWSAERVLAASI